MYIDIEVIYLTCYERMIQIIENYLNINIPKEFYPTIKTLFKEKKIKKSSILLDIGETAANTYILISGLMRSYYIDKNGNDITQYFLEPGDLFGYSKFTINEPLSVCIESIEDCILMEADGHNLLNSISNNNFALLSWIKMLETELRFKTARQSTYLLKNATERYLDFQKNYSEIEDRINQSYIASYLGITPVSLSRIRASLNRSNSTEKNNK